MEPCLTPGKLLEFSSTEALTLNQKWCNEVISLEYTKCLLNPTFALSKDSEII